MNKLIVKKKESGLPYLLNIEGIDCSGKSTLSNLLKDYFFNNYKLNTKVIHFPRYDTKEGKEIKKILNSGEALTEEKAYYFQSLYVVDQCNFTNEFDNGVYDEYDVLILDRYVFSVIPYTCMQTKNDFTHPMIRAFMSAIEDLVASKFLVVPDGVIYISCTYNKPADFSCSPNWYLISKRLKEKSNLDINESLDKLKIVHKFYDALFDNGFLNNTFTKYSISIIPIGSIDASLINDICKIREYIQIDNEKEIEKFIEENKYSFIRNIKSLITIK